jgi:Ca-activated chloride channel family protein
MKMKVLPISLFIVMITLLIPTSVFADGIIIPQPPICEPFPCPMPRPMVQLAIKYHHVEVEIEDQVATTRVDQVFRNDNDWTVEGTYVFPIPLGAAVDAFTLWIDGEPVQGEMLTKEQARQTYEEIVRTMRDPALLEYIDRQAVQASVFPIPPGGERRIQLEYSEILSADEELVHYRYPLNTEKFSTVPLEEVTIRVEIDGKLPIQAVYSPTHNVDLNRISDEHVVLGYEEYDVKPDRDFDLFFSIDQSQIGVNLMTYRDTQSEDPDGYFLLMLTPNIQVREQEAIAKDVILVLDKSGSMDGVKFRQAQDALKFVLDHLNPEDRFNVIAFSTGIAQYANRLRSAEEASEAARWVDSLAASGSTDIHRALQEAIFLTDQERPAIIIFLTDGLPTEGITETELIIENIRQSANSNVRLFAFGVGYDVDTYLLDTLAGENRGTTTYVTPEQAIDETVSGFYAKVSLPVLTDLELDFDDMVIYDAYPNPLPDLFAGTQLMLLGRYRGSGEVDLTLEGDILNDRVTYGYDNLEFRRQGGRDFIPRLWATRKIGVLLNQIRLQGADEETVDQIVRLSIRYGIITPYTSYLVTEPSAIGFEAQDEIVADALQDYMAAPMAVTGEEAVGRAAAESEIREAGVAPNLSKDEAELVQFAGTRTFRWVEGVWVDTSYDPGSMDTLKVPFLSEDYFELAQSRPDIGAALALGSRVIVVSDQAVYEIVDESEAGDAIVLPELFSMEDAENTEEEVTSSPERSKSSESGKGFTFPCPGSGMIGLIALVIVTRGMKPQFK